MGGSAVMLFSKAHPAKGAKMNPLVMIMCGFLIIVGCVIFYLSNKKPASSKEPGLATHITSSRIFPPPLNKTKIGQKALVDELILEYAKAHLNEIKSGNLTPLEDLINQKLKEQNMKIMVHLSPSSKYEGMIVKIVNM